MRSLIRPGLVFVVATAMVALPTVATGASSAPAANSATYQDSSGEDPTGQAPDITTITVSNDDAGMITFQINIPNRTSYARDIALLMLVDSDANQATGDTTILGADHIIQLFNGEIIMFRYSGTPFPDWPLAASQSSLSYSWANSPATIRISASDLNNSRRLSFRLLVFSGIIFDDQGNDSCPEPDCPFDVAPTVGFYTYDVRLTPPSLVVRRFTATPRTPVAGRPYTLRLVAARSDTGAVVQNGRVACIGRIGNARVRATVQRVVAGAATCTWNIPRTAQGKRFRGTVTISFEGLRAQQSRAARIR